MEKVKKSAPLSETNAYLKNMTPEQLRQANWDSVLSSTQVENGVEAEKRLESLKDKFLKSE